MSTLNVDQVNERRPYHDKPTPCMPRRAPHGDALPYALAHTHSNADSATARLPGARAPDGDALDALEPAPDDGRQLRDESQRQAAHFDDVTRAGGRGQEKGQPAVHVRLAAVARGQLLGGIGGDVARGEQRLRLPS